MCFGYWSGIERQPKVLDGECLYLTAENGHNLLQVVLSTENRRDGALCEIGFQAWHRAQQIEDFFYRRGLLNRWPDEKNHVVDVQAALEPDLGRLHSSQDSVCGGLEQEPMHARRPWQ